MARTKYQATDSRGKTHTRSTATRTYTHCVVVHFAARGGRPAHSGASWSGSAALAEREASRCWGRTAVEAVEILDASEVRSVSPARRALTIKAAQDDLRGIGMVLTHDDGEFRVNFRGGEEATAYYTDDLSDAISTAGKMRQRRDDAAKL